MGESVKIKDLIYRIVKLSGLTVKDKENLNGDIEIKVTGLGPGEKLYEELLLGKNSQNTRHLKIKKANDSYIPYIKLEVDLNILKTSLESNKAEDVKKMLEKIVENYKSNSKIIDHIYIEQKNSEG
jgi:FlaA1/EpsC-like NDP-sugar epimerase